MPRIFHILALGVALTAGRAVAFTINNQQEVIYYFDPDRPPVIEHYDWDEKKHWVLIGVTFDSDGDWALDTGMYYWLLGKKMTQKEKEALHKLDEKTHSYQVDGAHFSPFSEAVTNKRKLYNQADLYKALEADKTFRLDNFSGFRLLEGPRPWWSGNLKIRESAAYENLLKRLSQVQLAPPPQVPVK